MRRLESLIKLADNPEFEDVEDTFGGDDEFGLEDGFGDEGDLDNDDLMGDEGGMDEFGDDDEFGAEDEMADAAFKGKRVFGPRTKLASADVADMVMTLAKSVNALAKVQKAMLESSGMTSKVAKDDTASTFGEKDSTQPGNRPFDQTNPGDDDTILNAGPGAGPGPVSKSKSKPTDYEAMQQMVNRAVRRAVSSMGASQLNKARTPGVGSASSSATNSQLDKGLDVKVLQDRVKQLSFKQINDLRASQNDLPAGIL